MTGDGLELYRCTTWGHVVNADERGAIGSIHAHAEKHMPWWSVANIERLDDHVERIRVTEYEEVGYEDFPHRENARSMSL